MRKSLHHIYIKSYLHLYQVQLGFQVRIILCFLFESETVGLGISFAVLYVIVRNILHPQKDSVGAVVINLKEARSRPVPIPTQ